MKKGMKKFIKYGLIGCGGLGLIIAVVLVVVVIWNWQTATVLLGNKNPVGKVGKIPEVTVKELPPVTKGENDWTCWLGPNGDGSSNITEIPENWSKGFKKLWEIDYLCQGKGTAVWSAPVIRGNRLVVCGRTDADDLVFCLNPDTGELLWKSSYPVKASKGYGSGPRATPWIDDKRVYTFGRSGDLVCWNLFDGKKIWHKKVTEEGGKAPHWGYSSSPLVYDSIIVVNGGGQARTIAYDKMSGEVKWKTGSGSAGYAALRTMKIGDKEVILTFYGKGLSALNPENGKELWSSRWETPHNVNATTPMVSGDKIFISSGYGTGGETLKVTENEAKVVWKNKTIASHHSDPFIINDHIYGYSGQSMQNRGTFKCVDLLTGDEKWSSKEMGWGTLVYVDDHLLCMDIKGNLFLMKPDPAKFIKVTEMPNALGKVKGAAWTKPIIANNKLYLRFMQKLICYELKK